jgi:hypothetical protein
MRSGPYGANAQKSGVLSGLIAESDETKLGKTL